MDIMMKEFLEGIPITDQCQIFYDLAENIPTEQAYQQELFEVKERLRFIDNRFRVPIGQSKKWYQALLKDTKENIEYFKKRYRESNNDYSKASAKNYLDEYVEKEKKIKNNIQYLTKHKDSPYDIPKAKGSPMINLLEFNAAGFAKCLWHGPEKTSSLYYYKKTNTVHCFGCGKNADTIDVFMKIHNVSFGEAIKSLCY